MSGSLDHSPAQVVAQLLVDLAVGSVPTDSGAWPVYDTSLPDEPDDAVCIYDTSGELDSRMMIGGEWEERHGISVRLRTTDHQTGVTKINALARALDVSVGNTAVSMTSPTAVYAIQSMSRKSGPFDNGPEPTSGRRIFTINYVASLRQVS